MQAGMGSTAMILRQSPIAERVDHREDEKFDLRPVHANFPPVDAEMPIDRVREG